MHISQDFAQGLADGILRCSRVGWGPLPGTFLYCVSVSGLPGMYCIWDLIFNHRVSAARCIFFSVGTAIDRSAKNKSDPIANVKVKASNLNLLENHLRARCRQRLRSASPPAVPFHSQARLPVRPAHLRLNSAKLRHTVNFLVAA